MEDRDLTLPERETLNALLSISFPGVAELRRQAANVRARSGCECGCPTINLIPSRSIPPASASTSRPVEGYFTDPAGEVAGLALLFVADGWLSELEYAPVGDSTPAQFPPALTLTDIRVPANDADPSDFP